MACNEAELGEEEFAEKMRQQQNLQTCKLFNFMLNFSVLTCAH
jgi:hypothetical protein